MKPFIEILAKKKKRVEDVMFTRVFPNGASHLNFWPDFPAVLEVKSRNNSLSVTVHSSSSVSILLADASSSFPFSPVDRSDRGIKFVPFFMPRPVGSLVGMVAHGYA